MTPRILLYCIYVCVTPQILLFPCVTPRILLYPCVTTKFFYLRVLIVLIGIPLNLLPYVLALLLLLPPIRYNEVSRVLKVFKETLGNGYVRMELACILDGYYLCTSAGIIFFSSLKIIKLLQFNNRMNLLGLTFARCWDDLRVFFLTFAIIFFAFTTSFLHHLHAAARGIQ
ncbi:hypothetical protein Pcinc_038515 [Petrolisthes cinctipes]|uniref:Polycystin cation channel PKD1/PKD2 domain-containing protein n=1 Tax=Petrolisthes cinctipes TaxID=88211 RepID=A0AAE1BQE7_PETCI|nr:hypothetical protein Pcinc_038515 [Petrolisthes cinctipes]